MSVEGILPVVPTPFRDGRFDERAFAAMVERSAGSVDGYTVLGSTGEAPSMTTAERMQVAALMAARVPDTLDLIVGVTHTSVADSIELARHADSLGVAGVLCAAPFYFLARPDGVLAFLARVDDALESELVLYDNPVATKLHLDASVVVRWSEEIEHLNTVKLTDHDLDKVGTWQAAGLKVMAGDDPILFQYLAAGVDGAMVIAPVVFPEEFRSVWDLARSGDLDAALAALVPILPFLHVFGIGDEVATTKSLLASIDVFGSDEVRPPLVRTGPARRALLQSAFVLAGEPTHGDADRARSPVSSRARPA